MNTSIQSGKETRHGGVNRVQGEMVRQVEIESASLLLVHPQ